MAILRVNSNDEGCDHPMNGRPKIPFFPALDTQGIVLAIWAVLWECLHLWTETGGFHLGRIVQRARDTMIVTNMHTDEVVGWVVVITDPSICIDKYRSPEVGISNSVCSTYLLRLVPIVWSLNSAQVHGAFTSDVLASSKAEAPCFAANSAAFRDPAGMTVQILSTRA